MNAEKSTKKTKEIITKEKFIDLLKKGERNFRGKIFDFEINPNLLKEVITSCKEKPKKDFVEENGITNINIELDFTEAEFDKKVNFKKVNFNQKVDFSKVKFKEEADFKRVEFKEEADFIRAEFKKKAKFSEVNFLNETDFIKTKFEEEVDFENAIFSEDLNCREAEFNGEANFIKAEFLRKTVFQKTNFKKKVKFKEAEFLGESDFSNFQICKTCDFEEARFLNQNNFYEINKFFETIGIDKTNFKKIKHKKIIFVRKRTILKQNFFEKLRYTKRGNFKNRIFDFTINRTLLEEIFLNVSVNSKTKSNESSKIIIDTELNFTGAVFNEKVDFTGTVFKKKINFCKSIFKNKAIFSDTEFSKLKNSEEKYKNSKEKYKLRKNELDKYIVEVLKGLEGVSFEQAAFKGETRFKEAKFLSKANFYKTEFSDTANFNTAIFKDETHFGYAKFESIVHFSNAELKEDTDFTFAVFKGLTSFRETKFANKLSFYKTKFADHVNFNESEFKDCYKEKEEEDAAVFGKTEFSEELDFENIIIEGNNPLRFNSVIFSRQYLTDFCEINEKKKTKVSGEKEPALLIFKDISFPSEVVFSRCNLSKTEFNTCIIDSARFLNCTFLNSSFPLNPFKRDRFYVAGEGEKDKRKSWIIVKFVWAFLLFFLPIIYFFSNFVGVVCVLVILLFFISGRGLYLFYDEKKKNPLGWITKAIKYFCNDKKKENKNQDNEDQEQLIRHREDQEQLSRQMKSSLEASKSWKQAGDFYIDELELRRRKKKILNYCGLSIYKYYLGYAERFTVILFWIFALFFYTTSFNYKKGLDYFKEIRNSPITKKIEDKECNTKIIKGEKMFTEKCITMLAMETGYSEECIKATNNSVFILISKCSAVDSIKKSANLLIFPLTLRTQTKGFETLSDVAFVMLSWPVWLAFFIAIKRRFRF